VGEAIKQKQLMMMSHEGSRPLLCQKGNALRGLMAPVLMYGAPLLALRERRSRSGRPTALAEGAGEDFPLTGQKASIWGRIPSIEKEITTFLTKNKNRPKKGGKKKANRKNLFTRTPNTKRVALVRIKG